MKKLRPIHFPIRLKILVSALLVVILVVALITSTMANLFRQDKTFYVRDMASVMSQHVAEEAASLLRGYGENLQVFSDVLFDADITPRHKSKMIGQLFDNYPHFIGISAYLNDAEPVVIYDEQTLRDAGLAQQDLLNFRADNPLPMDSIRRAGIYVRNETTSSKLPLLVVAIARDNPDGGQAAVVAAWVRLDQLLAVTSRSSDFQTMLVDAGNTVLADTDATRAIQRVTVARTTELDDLRAQANQRGTTVEINRNGQELIAAYARTGIADVIAGVEIPRTVAYLTANALLSNLLRVAVGLFLCAAVVSLFFSRRLTRPLEQLSEAANAVGKGQFDITLKSESRDEIGVLSHSFNQMTSELRDREVALKDAQALLVQSEKMSAFGQIGAGIAHEVKNPLAGILGYTQLALRKVEDDDPLREKLKIIEKETKRCTEIISNLMKFARQEKVVFSAVNLNQVVKDAIAIVDHQLSVSGVRLRTVLAPDLPSVQGSANQLQQVLMNFAINAQQAMGEAGGELIVTTGLAASGAVEVSVRDTGPGIPPDILDKIFEPFFTTKPSGKGTGLGLSVTYGIIQEHKGAIRAYSVVGEGTTFVVSLPAASEDSVPLTRVAV